MTNHFPLISLGKTIHHKSNFVEIDDYKQYKRCRVQLHAQGIAERDILLGSEIKTKKQQICQANDFLVAEIDAKLGGFGIVPESLNGAIVSSHYFLFQIDESVLNRHFLKFFIRTPAFLDQVRAKGTTNYAAIRPSDILNYEIPLPPLVEQQRIVAHIEELAVKIEEARGLRQKSAEEAEILNRQAYELVWIEAEKISSRLSLLENLADVIDPQPDHRTPPEMINGMPYVSIANISRDGVIDVLSARKVSPLAVEKQEASFTLRTGDIVLGKIGTIGAARPILVRERLALSANVVLVQPHRNKLLDKLLLALLRSPQAESQFLNGTRTSAQGAFGIKKMRKLFIPWPSLSAQHSLITTLESMQSKVDTLKRLQAETSAELNAMLPSILDKVFKGEL